MELYSITTVVNNEKTLSSSSFGSAGVWIEIFKTKEEAIELLNEWGCVLTEEKDTYFKQKHEDNKVYNFYYKINLHYFNQYPSL